MKKDIKGEIKTYYGGIAKKVTKSTKSSCGCGTSCCGSAVDESILLIRGRRLRYGFYN